MLTNAPKTIKQIKDQVRILTQVFLILQLMPLTAWQPNSSRMGIRVRWSELPRADGRGNQIKREQLISDIVSQE